jgi:hypothetical protein
MFDLGLTLGRGETIGPASEETMLLVFIVVLPGEGRAAPFIDSVAAAAAAGGKSSEKVRGDGVGRENEGSLIGSGTVIGGGVDTGPEGLEAVEKKNGEGWGMATRLLSVEESGVDTTWGKIEDS